MFFGVGFFVSILCVCMCVCMCVCVCVRERERAREIKMCKSETGYTEGTPAQEAHL